MQPVRHDLSGMGGPVIAPLSDCRSILAECPLWSEEEQRLYWLDLIKPAVHAWSASEDAVRTWPMDEYLGGLVKRDAGGLVLGMQRRIAVFDPVAGGLEELALFPEAGENVRFNDAGCDAHGRLLIGSMLDPDLPGGPAGHDRAAGAGAIHALYPGQFLRLCEPGYTTPNGFSWNLDGTRLYVADSDQKLIFAYDYGPDGSLGRKRVFAALAEQPGVPDGSCVDSEDCLWTAVHGGWRLLRFSPEGTLIGSLALPVQYPTSVAFGGSDGATLFVTSASRGLDQGEKSRQPLAGAVLRVALGEHCEEWSTLRGAPVHSFRG